MGRTLYTEVVTKTNGDGKRIESFCKCFDREVLENQRVVTVESSFGKVFVYDFKTLEATWWRVGNPNDQHRAKIILKN